MKKKPAPQRLHTLDQLIDQHVGPHGTARREKFEFELRVDILGELIKQARQQRKLTQEQLGKLVGVQKAQISRLENNATNVTIGTVLRVFAALRGKVSFKVELMASRTQTK